MSGNTLTLSRGQFWPTKTHAAGTRIAALVRDWDEHVEFDTTANCPSVNVGAGPETWIKFQARRGAAVMASADWDGLMADQVTPDPSYIIDNTTTRSFDPARTNSPPASYASFYSAWAAGMVAYGNALRAACPADAILLTNGNTRNYNVNGNTFEGQPTASYSLQLWNWVVRSWYDTVGASYFEWMDNAADPNLSTIMVFGNVAYSGTNGTANFTAANYQLMRYGLCTALLKDGYFAYETSTNEHGVGGLFWFDEYDNAGKGKGYLGQPAAAAYSAGSNVMRRDYTGGTVLVNPDTVAHTVSLGGTFRKINGTQQPTVNDGSLVTQVTLQPRDGIVLLGEGAHRLRHHQALGLDHLTERPARSPRAS